MYESFLSPVFSNLQGREEYINNLDKKFDTFTEWYEYIIQHHQTMIELAKWHVRNHWEEVDWDKYCIEIDGHLYDNCKYQKYPDNPLGEVFKEIDSECIPFASLKFVYDETDGDLSIDVDGKFKFMDDEEVINAAVYIESKWKRK